jgi:tetratricopeptide (TPR) repeat protein
LAVIAVACVAAVVAAPFIRDAWPEGPMTKDIKIAIAQFGEIVDGGAIRPSVEGKNLSENIYRAVASEIATVPDLKEKTEFRYNIDVVEGKTENERIESARLAAQRWNADLLVYGYLEKTANGVQVSPNFEVKLSGAEEIRGPTRLGSPITVSADAPLPDYTRSQQVSTRVQMLALFVPGIANLISKDYDHALTFFERASTFRQGGVQEVSLLFLGTTYLERYRTYYDPLDLQLARDAYRKAIWSNPHYGRAYIGLGNAAYSEYQHGGEKDAALLDLAASGYEQAIRAVDKPTAAYVDAKANIGLGNVNIVKAQPPHECEDCFAKAEDHYGQVVAEYEGGQVGVTALLGSAYLGLGAVQQLWTRDLYRAEDYFERAIRASGGNEAVRNEAGTKLAEVRGELARGGGPK